MKAPWLEALEALQALEALDEAVPAPSSDFAARVAQAARKDYVARRSRRVVVASSVIVLAAAAAIALRLESGANRLPSPTAAQIVPDVPHLLPGSISWDVGSKDWVEDLYKFPLSFAPTLPYRGMVPIHFSETFMSPGTPAYWSYVPIWVKAGVPASEAHDARGLELDLQRYYAGLCKNSGHPVAHTKSPTFDSYEAHLAPAPLEAEDRAGGGAWVFRGDLQTVDCLVTGGELSLNVEAVVGPCDEHTSFTAYSLSPRPFADPIWTGMRAERRAFRCRHAATEERIGALTTFSGAPPVVIPDTPAGRSLTWILGAIEHPPTEAEVAARISPSLLARIPAATWVTIFKEELGAYAPPVVERVDESTRDGLTVVFRSGDRTAPILGRRRELKLEVDPEDETRLRAMHDIPVPSADISESGAH